MRAHIFALSLTACGGAVLGAADGGDGGLDGSALDAGAVTACSGPGMKLCGGQCGQSCPVDKCLSTFVDPKATAKLGICPVTGGAHFESTGCQQCGDGYLCAMLTEVWSTPDPIFDFDLMECADPGWALMYHLNGRDNLARYSDRSAYTGEPLPQSPVSCPSFPGLRLCGGACGECPTGEKCVGRSPMHPYSLCVRSWKPHEGGCRRTPTSCDGTPYDVRCLTFNVDGPSQPVADAYSLCVDRATCEAAALYYPGGAFCTGGPLGK